MPINNKLKIVFVHIPKTGGSSIEKSLNMYGFQNSGENCIFDPTILFGHELQLMTTDEIYSYLAMNQLNPNNYLWITIVRNPFDRMISEFLWRSKWDYRLRHINLITFVDNFVKPNSERIDSLICRHFISQSTYIKNSKGIDVKVFRLEDGLEKVSDYLDKFGITCDIPHINKTNRSKLMKNLSANECYRIKNTLFEIYQEDYELLRYKL